MKSFVDLDRTLGGQPPRLGAVLARIDTGRGREQLYHDQLPELLQALANQTKVASISASSAIEGVTVTPDRAERIVEGDAPPRFRNRNEREFAGYRDAIDAITRAEQQEPLSVPLILRIHRDLFRHTEALGGYLKTDDNLIVGFEKGYREVLFKPPPWQQTEWFLTELVERYNSAVAGEIAHPLVLASALILDFLAIHPVADGNGRVARILTTQQLLARGYGVSRYVSVEQRIYDSKNAYYDALYQSQRGWHESDHSIWPWTEYLVDVLAESYDTFEARIAAERGLSTLNKQERVRVWVLEHAPASFRLRDARRALPGISDPTIGNVLRNLRDEELLQSIQDGPQSAWRRL
jgi:Fic family protein